MKRRQGGSSLKICISALSILHFLCYSSNKPKRKSKTGRMFLPVFSSLWSCFSLFYNMLSRKMLFGGRKKEQRWFWENSNPIRRSRNKWILLWGLKPIQCLSQLQVLHMCINHTFCFAPTFHLCSPISFLFSLYGLSPWNKNKDHSILPRK